MSLDFSVILFSASLATGLIWMCDSLFWRPKRLAAAIKNKVEASSKGASKTVKLKEPVVVEYARSFFPILLVVFLLRSFLIEPFRIPSGSMEPTLLVGDFILVNKYTYGIRLPIINKNIMPIHDLKRGDVVVFRYPVNPSEVFIKRLIGLPGDEIVYTGKNLLINGEPITKQFEGEDELTNIIGRHTTISRFLENLDGVEHEIYEYPETGREVTHFTVPANSYFMMGDNRDNSDDSRIWGVVPEDHIVGKAFAIWMSWDKEAFNVRFNRIGKKIP